MATIEKEKALDVVRQMVADGQVSQEVAEKYFHELKESEDERIRKWLIYYFTEVCDNVSEKEKKGVLVWLEKQGNKDEEILVLKDQIESLHAAIKALKEAHKIELEKQCENTPVWSESDNYVADKVLAWAKIVNPTSSIFEKLPKEQFIERLESIKERYTWKPSDEQIKALNYVVNLMASSASPNENDYYYNVFKDLRKQIKKLREEYDYAKVKFIKEL